jgi:hypothetical protein
MKICPHCDGSFPEQLEKCPQCGADYWDSDRNGPSEASRDREEEDQGCLSILIFQLLIALALTTLFVLFGFIVNLLVHFEANQVKIAWLAGSLLLGGSLSLLIRKIKEEKKKKKTRADYAE